MLILADPVPNLKTDPDPNSNLHPNPNLRYGSGDWMQHQYIPLPEEWPSEPDGEFDRRPYGLDEIFEVLLPRLDPVIFQAVDP